MNMKLYTNKKFIIATIILLIIFNLFFSNLLFNRIFSLDDSDFWSTLFIVKYGVEGGLRSSPFIKEFALFFSNSPESFAYFVINIFLILSIFLSYEIVNSFKNIKRNITYKYICIVFFSTSLNYTLASRAVNNIRWTFASLIYIIFIIKLYEYIYQFHSHKKYVRKIFMLKRYRDFPLKKNKFLSIIPTIFWMVLFLSIHSYSFYYLASFLFLSIIRLSNFFKQRYIAIIFFLSFTILSSLLFLNYSKNISSYLTGYRIYGLSEYILIFSTFILHFLYLIKSKFRNWIHNYYPWSEFLILSTSLGFIIPLPFMLTRIYVPYLVFFPILILTFLDKCLIKKIDLININ